MPKQWTIPVILRELRRVMLDASEQAYDIMEPGEGSVTEMVTMLTEYHMEKEMEIPGQTSLVTFAEKKDTTSVKSEK